MDESQIDCPDTLQPAEVKQTIRLGTSDLRDGLERTRQHACALERARRSLFQVAVDRTTACVCESGKSFSDIVSRSSAR